jgi:F0F1-type ATP synthase epsilon subunit
MAMLLARRAAFARVSARSSAPRLAAVSSRGFAEGGIPATINLNFATPAEQLFKNFEAKMVRVFSIPRVNDVKQAVYTDGGGEFGGWCRGTGQTAAVRLLQRGGTGKRESRGGGDAGWSDCINRLPSCPCAPCTYLPRPPSPPWARGQVTMKGSSGVFGVLPGHVPTIAQLQPGTVTVEYDSDEGSKVRNSAAWIACRSTSARPAAADNMTARHVVWQSEDFFVSAGFAYIKANSDVDVCAVEACKVEDIDAAVCAAYTTHNACGCFPAGALASAAPLLPALPPGKLQAPAR